jgi:hypothetical protein
MIGLCKIDKPLLLTSIDNQNIPSVGAQLTAANAHNVLFRPFIATPCKYPLICFTLFLAQITKSGW